MTTFPVKVMAAELGPRHCVTVQSVATSTVRAIYKIQQ